MKHPSTTLCKKLFYNSIAYFQRRIIAIIDRINIKNEYSHFYIDEWLKIPRTDFLLVNRFEAIYFIITPLHVFKQSL